MSVAPHTGGAVASRSSTSTAAPPEFRTYYESEGLDDPIQIEIDKGAYAPRFVRRDQTAPSTETAGSIAVSATASGLTGSSVTVTAR